MLDATSQPVLIVADSIAQFDRVEWDRCFPAELESWDYYRAVENARLPDFEFCYLGLRQAGQLVAVVPAFMTDYSLDTTVQGGWKRLTGAIDRYFPDLFCVRILCLGSPVSEICHLGFAPGIEFDVQADLLRRLLAAADGTARERGIGMVTIKDAAGTIDNLWQECERAGFQRLPSLPTAILPLPFARFEDYLASLSRATRKDMKRKLKVAGRIRIEQRRQIDDVLLSVVALYEATRARSDLQFEELPATYFAGVLSAMSGRASCFLYWDDAALVAFNLVLHDDHRLIDKFLGMDLAAARAYNLYFLSWATNVRYCIEQGIDCYQSGQADYGPKLRLGSHLLPNHLYFRHRQPAIHWLLRLVGRLVNPHHFDKHLQGKQAA